MICCLAFVIYVVSFKTKCLHRRICPPQQLCQPTTALYTEHFVAQVQNLQLFRYVVIINLDGFNTAPVLIGLSRKALHSKLMPSDCILLSLILKKVSVEFTLCKNLPRSRHPTASMLLPHKLVQDSESAPVEGSKRDNGTRDGTQVTATFSRITA